MWVKEKFDAYVKLYSASTVKRPIFGLCIGLAAIIFISGIAFTAYPLEIDSSGRSFRPTTSQIVENEDAITRAEEQTVFNPMSSGIQTAARQTSNEYSLTLFFLTPDTENVFKDSVVDYMRQVETEIVAKEGYSDVCLRLVGETECAPPASLLRNFYASSNVGCGTFAADGKAAARFQAIDDTLLALIDPDATPIFCSPPLANGSCSSECQQPSPNAIDRFVDIEFGYAEGVNASTATPDLEAYTTKLTFSFGLPLEGFASQADRRDEQIDRIERFVRSLRDFIQDLGTDEVEVLYESPILTTLHFESLIFGDVLLVVVSIIMVFFYIWFHTQSFFLAGIGILQVVLSFPVGYFFNQLFLDSGPLSALNFLTLFIVLGIGADDIFIFIDAWKQSEHLVPGDGLSEEEHEQRRLEFSFERAFKAMLITSLTTSSAFFLNLTSSVPSIATFGFSSGAMVLLNFMFVTTFYPCAVIIWDRKLKHVSCCFGSCKFLNARIFGRRESDGLPAAKASKADDSDTLRPVERYFKEVHVPTLQKYRYAVLAGFIIFVAISVGFASQLEDAEEPDQFVPNSDEVVRAFTLAREDYARVDSVIQVWVPFGIAGYSSSGVNKYNPESIGNARFQENFDLSPQASQQLFVDTCVRFRGEQFVLDGEVLCPMEDFAAFAATQGFAFPVPQADFLPLLRNFTAAFEAANGPADPLDDEDAESRSSRREQAASLPNTIAFHEDDSLAYMVLVVNTTVPNFEAGSTYEPFFDFFESVVSDIRGNATYQAAGMDVVLQTSSIWVEIEVSRTLKQAAILGITASLGLAFGMMVLLTQDLTLAALATVSIGSVTASLVATTVWAGWSLGIIESVTLTIVVGLSVDYVLHLGAAFKEVETSGRYNRVLEALTTIGISVMSASITTFLAAFILFFTYIIFFQRFGFFIALVVVYATLYAFGLFVVLLLLFGRNERANDLVAAWNFVSCRKPVAPRQRNRPSRDELVTNPGDDAVTVSYPSEKEKDNSFAV